MEVDPRHLATAFPAIPFVLKICQVCLCKGKLHSMGLRRKHPLSSRSLNHAMHLIPDRESASEKSNKCIYVTPERTARHKQRLLEKEVGLVDLGYL